MKDMKKDFVLPILVLTVICLVITAALAITNSFTGPVIAEAAALRAEEARNAIIPEAEGFEKLTLDGLPAAVTEVYKATNGIGYVIALTTAGYGGDMKILCGIDPDGFIIACRTLEQSETKGIGSKAIDILERVLPGADITLDGVDAVSGATITSRAYMGAVRDAYSAFEIAKESAQ
jgi:electron transport complex protein RnfG